MIDFHSHILPGVDDGAKDVETSLEMLRESKRQGVDTIVATPHCYLRDDARIPHYIHTRKYSYHKLMQAIEESGEELPKIILGFEVRIMKDFENMEMLRPLCIGDTDYILIEMPYGKWSVNDYDYIYRLMLKGMKPIMAHIERFWNHRKEFYNLYSMNLLYQVNAESFLHFRSKMIIPELFADGAVHIIGSDMHDVSWRKTCMKKASERIISAYGQDRLDYLMNNARLILENREPERGKFYKMSALEKMKL